MGNCSALPQLFCLSSLARAALAQQEEEKGGEGGVKMFKKGGKKKSASHVVQKILYKQRVIPLRTKEEKWSQTPTHPLPRFIPPLCMYAHTSRTTPPSSELH